MKYNWGIIGCGKIAATFAESLKITNDGTLYAVASRSLEKSSQFAENWACGIAYGSYEELISDSEVDIVYIATPHNGHAEWSQKALKCGKAVLCEKPMSINAKEARETFQAAKASKSFYMEAMWMYFLPAIRKVKEIVDRGDIGEVRILQADFCFRKDLDPESRLFDPELAGGALLDVGIYPIALSYLIFEQEPIDIKTIAAIGETGVDEQSSYLFRYKNGAQAQLSSAIRVNASKEARIYGTKGSITLPDFWKADTIILQLEDEDMDVIKLPYPPKGFQFEIEEVMRCLDRGLLQSPAMSESQSLRIMSMMDNLRSEWALKYPGE